MIWTYVHLHQCLLPRLQLASLCLPVLEPASLSWLSGKSYTTVCYIGVLLSVLECEMCCFITFTMETLVITVWLKWKSTDLCSGRWWRSGPSYKGFKGEFSLLTCSVSLNCTHSFHYLKNPVNFTPSCFKLIDTQSGSLVHLIDIIAVRQCLQNSHRSHRRVNRGD